MEPPEPAEVAPAEWDAPALLLPPPLGAVPAAPWGSPEPEEPPHATRTPTNAKPATHQCATRQPGSLCRVREPTNKTSNLVFIRNAFTTIGQRRNVGTTDGDDISATFASRNPILGTWSCATSERAATREVDAKH